MAIVLNGTGSISGLSAGGLPDASVTQSDLATGVAGTGPAFSAYCSNSQSISNTTLATLQFNTEVFDTAGCYDTTTYRFTPNVAGYYLLTATVSLSSFATGECFGYIVKNSSGQLMFDYTVNNFWAGGNSTIFYANGTTDYFTAQFYHSSGSSRTLNSAASFSGTLVRAA